MCDEMMSAQTERYLDMQEQLNSKAKTINKISWDVQNKRCHIQLSNSLTKMPSYYGAIDYRKPSCYGH